jgi:Leucine-rich repeat (LRR) protein
VSVLGSLPHLARLHLKNNKINTSFGRTNQFKALIFLDLSGNYISSLSVLALSCCATLRTLVLCDNFLTRLDGLNRIKELRVCIVDGNKLSRTESNTFDGCVNLKVLSLRRNAFRTLKHLSNLDSIRELKLDDNRIIDIEEISWLACLPRLRALSLIGNNIVTECDRYFEFVTACCSGLSILDGKSLSPSQIAQ